jgi:hypothetical protein
MSTAYDDVAPRKRWASVPNAVSYSDRSKSTLYIMAKQHPGLFRKHGRATLVDLVKLDQILSELPPADLTTSN